MWIILFIVPFAMARLDMEPLVISEPIMTFCIGPGCPVVSVPETVRETNFTCNGTSESLHADETDCHSYYKCSNGNATKLVCPSSYGFYKLGSDWGYCALETYVKSCNTIDCTLNGAVPDPLNCTRFFVCLNGRPHSFQCPNGTLFSAIVGQCVFVSQGAGHPCSQETVPSNTTSPTTVAPVTTTQEIPLTSDLPYFPNATSTGIPEVQDENATTPNIQFNEV